MKDDELFYEVEERSAARIIRLRGRLGLSNVEEFRDEFFRLVEKDSQPLVFDCSALTQLDSSGIGLLLQIHKRMEAGGRTTTLRNLRPEVARTMQVAGLDRVFQLDEQQAD